MIPAARSVIVFGIKLVSGVVNWPQLAWDDARAMRVAVWQVYDHGGFDAVNMRLEQIAELGAHRQSTADARADLAPFSFRHAAVRAGLATFGASNLALHPVLGPRTRFNVVISEAELDQYDSPLTEAVCLYDQGCRECIRTCPQLD